MYKLRIPPREWRGEGWGRKVNTRREGLGGRRKLLIRRVMIQGMFFHERTSKMIYALLFFSFLRSLLFYIIRKEQCPNPNVSQSKQFIKARDLTDVDILFGILTALFKGMPCAS